MHVLKVKEVVGVKNNWLEEAGGSEDLVHYKSHSIPLLPTYCHRIEFI